MSNEQEKYEIPVILYEEPSSADAKAIPFPYIEVQKDKKMPPVLFIFEYHHTGETEPDDQGREAEVVDQIPHKYIDMEFLKEKLPPEINDMVRLAVGMQPLKLAQTEGKKILDKVFSKAPALQAAAQKQKESKIEEHEAKKSSKKRN